MKKNILIILTLTILYNSAIAQEVELFPGEGKLNDCKIETPMSLYYKTKDKAAFIQKAKQYKDTELVLLTYNKKTKTATYKSYYLVVDERKEQVFVYLESPESHKEISGNKQAVFLSDNPKNERFYVLECLLKTVSENPELKTIIIQ